jgi:hypothetical protein
MFNLKLDATATYWWPVDILAPKPDGSIGSHPIKVLYARLDEDAHDKLQDEIREANLSDRVVAQRVMRGFEGVAGEDGVTLPWSDENRDALLSVPGVGTAIVAAFYQSRSQAALGNLMRSRAAGPAATPTAAATPPSP